MNNKHVTKYLNEIENIVSEPEYLLTHTDEFCFNRYGQFFFLRTENKEPIDFLKLKEKSIGNYEVVYVVGHEELWGKGLGTEALRQALYTAFFK